MGKYATGTYSSKNLLRRYAHRVRFEKSLKMILSEQQSNIRLLDVGCGDGYFLSELSRRITGDMKGFEPFMEDSVYNKENIFLKWEQINGYVKREGSFDIIT